MSNELSTATDCRHTLRAALMIAGLSTITAIALPASAAADRPIAARATTPPVLKLAHKSETTRYNITVRPGVPQAGETVTIELFLASILDAPDATYGMQKPIDDAVLTAVLVQAKVKGKGRKLAPWVDARSAMKISDAGTYAFSFTTPKEGLYGLHLQGTSGSGPIAHSVVISANTWPIPKDATPAPLPKKLPEVTAGNAAHGASLCSAHCTATFADATKKPISSAFAESHSDAQLLKVATKNAGKGLSAIQKGDLLYYLRGQHMRVTDFFPNAAAYTFKTFTINTHGRERLADTAKIKLTDEQATAKVFIVYKGDSKATYPELVPYDDTVARDGLNKADKVGYLMFLNIPGEKRANELGLALGLETVYPIIDARARGTDGTVSKPFNKQLATFKGKGKFNDARSLRKGTRSMQAFMLPVYLKAAELATMYYAAEREFTVFDNAFD